MDEEVKEYSQFVNLSAKDLSKEKEEMMKYLMEEEARKQQMIYVMYKYPCCEDYTTFALDRYPMSESILTHCSKCDKYVPAELVKPVEFYLPWTKEIHLIEDFEDMEFTGSDKYNQVPFIKHYLMESKINKLESICDSEICKETENG